MQIMVGVFGTEMAVSFRSSGVGPNAGILGSFRKPTYCLRTVKTAQVDGWTKLSMCAVCKILLKLDGMDCVENDMLMHAKLMC